MTEFDAGQFDIAVIGAGHRGPRQKPGRALRVQAFLHSKNLGGGGIHYTAVGGFAALRMWRTLCGCFRRALQSPTGTRAVRGNGMERSR